MFGFLDPNRLGLPVDHIFGQIAVTLVPCKFCISISLLFACFRLDFVMRSILECLSRISRVLKYNESVKDSKIVRRMEVQGCKCVAYHP